MLDSPDAVKKQDNDRFKNASNMTTGRILDPQVFSQPL